MEEHAEHGKCVRPQHARCVLATEPKRRRQPHTRIASFAHVPPTHRVLPAAADSVSEQGYMPRDLYNLNSRYGSEGDLIQ